MEISDKSLEELQELETDAIARFDAADEADDLDAMQVAATEIEEIQAAIEAAGGKKKGDEDPDEDKGDKAPPFEKKDEPVVASAEAGADAAPAVESAPAEPVSEAVVEAPVEVVTDPVEPATEPTTEPATEVAPEPEVTPEGETPAEEAPADPSSDTVSEEQTDATAEVDNTNQTEEDPVDVPEDRKPEVSEEPTLTTTITAGAGLSGIAVTEPFKSREQMNQSMSDRINALRSVRGGAEDRHTIATIVASGVSDDRLLVPGDPDGNFAKIKAFTEPGAITASGGYCAPLETRYDIFGAGVTDRPVRDALAGFQAQRGGIRFTQAPKIADYGDSLGIWTGEMDETLVDGGGAPITKPCLKVECSPEDTAELDAVTLCLEFGNLMTRAYPELVDRHNQLALVAHARFAENELLRKISALSIPVTSAFKLGTARDFLASISRAATAYRFRYRLNPTDTLRTIAPAWVRDAMRLDLAFQLPGDNALEDADRKINSFLSLLNVNVSWHLDGPGFSPEVSASTLDDFPSSFKWTMYLEGSLLFMDGGTLGLGVIRDSELVGTNDYKTFTETFEGVANIGGEVLEVTTTTHVAGGTVGSVAVA